MTDNHYVELAGEQFLSDTQDRSERAGPGDVCIDCNQPFNGAHYHRVALTVPGTAGPSIYGMQCKDCHRAGIEQLEGAAPPAFDICDGGGEPTVSTEPQQTPAEVITEHVQRYVKYEMPFGEKDGQATIDALRDAGYVVIRSDVPLP